MTDEEKMQFNIRSEEEMRRYLCSLPWEEKIASIERMNEAGRIAREGMRKVLESEARTRESASVEGVFSEACDVKPLA